MVYLNFQELLQTDHVSLCGILQSLFLGLEHETSGQCMTVLAVLAIRTLPKPAELLRLDSLDKVLAHNLERRSG